MPIRMYNPDLQIHASYVLFNQVQTVKLMYEKSGYSLASFDAVQLLMGSHDDKTADGYDKLMSENNQLRQEILKLKESLSLRHNVFDGNQLATKAGDTYPSRLAIDEDLVKVNKLH
jgi:hypothetical protein